MTPSYSERAFSITETTLTFHVSPQDSTFHPIVRLRETEYLEEEGTTAYTVFYSHYRDQYESRFCTEKIRTRRSGSSIRNRCGGERVAPRSSRPWSKRSTGDQTPRVGAYPPDPRCSTILRTAVTNSSSSVGLPRKGCPVCSRNFRVSGSSA